MNAPTFWKRAFDRGISTIHSSTDLASTCPSQSHFRVTWCISSKNTLWLKTHYSLSGRLRNVFSVMLHRQTPFSGYYVQFLTQRPLSDEHLGIGNTHTTTWMWGLVLNWSTSRSFWGHPVCFVQGDRYIVCCEFGLNQNLDLSYSVRVYNNRLMEFSHYPSFPMDSTFTRSHVRL